MSTGSTTQPIYAQHEGQATGCGLNVVVLGLTLSSSWGNGHATTFRALLSAFVKLGHHQVTFLERERPWYADNRDLPSPDWCRLEFYHCLEELEDFHEVIASADAVIVGSYVPDGVEVGRFVQRHARGVTAFYDIDTPVTLAKLARGDHEYISPDLIPGYDIYLSFTGGPVLDQLMQRYGAPAARPLYCAVNTSLYRPLSVPRLWDLSYLGTYSEDRQPTLQRLLIEPARRFPDKRFVVAGPMYPDDIDWPANVERRNHVPPADHPAFYAASMFTLNVTRSDMIMAGHSPSVRLFEAAACGVPVVSDRWAGIDRIFVPDEEIVVADRSEDVVALLRHVTPERRTGIGRAARRRVLAEHDAAHRAAELERHLREAARAGGGAFRTGRGWQPGSNLNPLKGEDDEVASA